MVEVVFLYLYHGIVNGYIVYKEITGKRISPVDYMKAVSLKITIIGGKKQNERPGPLASCNIKIF